MMDISTSSTDHELLEKYREGDATAFDIFYQRHEKRIFSFIKYSTLNSAMAEDCCQVVWMKVIDKLDYILEATNREPKKSEKKSSSLWTLYPYIKTMAHNTVMDALKRKHVKLDVSGDGPADVDDKSSSRVSYLTLVPGGRDIEPENALESEQKVAMFYKALQLLPQEQRQAWLLSREKLFSLKQCAEIEGIDIQAFRSRLRRAKDKLTPVLDEIFPDWKDRGFTKNRSKS